MERVPRHEFAPERYRDQAYEDHPLPIGEGQTISQPYIVALMLEALKLSPTDKVLEIGTGSGYVTALLAELAARVISIERHAIPGGVGGCRAGATWVLQREGSDRRRDARISGSGTVRCDYRVGRCAGDASLILSRNWVKADA